MLKKLILIAGPTGSGKSKLAIHLAKKLDGEIVSYAFLIILKFLNGNQLLKPDSVFSIIEY